MAFLRSVRRRLGGGRKKVPTVLQMEAAECGAAALAMILAYYGMWATLESLRMECGVGRDGSKASNIVRAARKRGCAAQGHRLTVGMLKSEECPMILHWEFNHFVVLEDIDEETAYLNDPAMGRRQVPLADLRTSYTGIALKIAPGPEFRPEGEPYSIVRALREKLLVDKWAMVYVSLVSLFMVIPGLATPVFSQIFIDDIFTGKHRDWMFNLCLAMALAIVVTFLLTSLRAFVLTRWQQKLTLADSSRFLWHTLRLPMQFFRQRYAAEIASRIEFNEAVASVLSDAAATAVLDLLVGLFFLALLLSYSVKLTLIGAGFSLANAAAFLLMRRRMTDLNMRMQQDAGKEYGTLVNGLTMIESVKANGTEADLFARWAGYRAKMLESVQETQQRAAVMTALPAFFTGLNTALIMTIGGFSIMEGVMTAGVFMAFQTLIASFQAPMGKLVTLGTTLQTTEMQMRRLDDVRRYPVDQLNYPFSSPSAETSFMRLSGELELRNVSFGYNPLEPPFLSDFCLHLHPGRWVALAGASGSGKSTLAKIVSGLYEEWSGEVLLDGRNRRDIPHAVIVRSVAVVDQDIFHLSGTVADNIALFDSSVGRSAVVQAAKDACIHEDILRMEGGYEGRVSEGGMNFSGGQRQRLEIARALVRNPSLLILDEATSALDPLTEKTVLENIRRRGCSCVLVAHRLSTIRDCDEIIVLESGRVAERGTHREMMRHDGPYRRLIEEVGSQLL